MDKSKNNEYQNAITKLLEQEISKAVEAKAVQKIVEKISTDIFEHELEKAIKEKVEEQVNLKMKGVYESLSTLVENIEDSKRKSLVHPEVAVASEISEGDLSKFFTKKTTIDLFKESRSFAYGQNEVAISGDNMAKSHRCSENAKYDFTNPKNNYVIENVIKYVLDQKKMTQNDLAEKTGISRSTIGNIVNNPSSMTLINAFKVARVLEKDIEELFLLFEVNDSDSDGK